MALCVFSLTATTQFSAPAEIPAPAADEMRLQPEAMPSAFSEKSPDRYFTPQLLLAIFILLACAAVFSACEVAYFSLYRLHMHGMNKEDSLDRLVLGLMEHPGRLLATISLANTLASMLASVLMALPSEKFFGSSLGFSPFNSFILSIVTCTTILLLFTEILPKALALHHGKFVARALSPIVFLMGFVMPPLQNSILYLTGVLFRLLSFSKAPPSPFMTDEEFFTLLTESEASGVIEKDERKMIQGILDLKDVMLREILVPRPDMVALKAASTVGEALEVFRIHEYSRIPVYLEDLDHIIGILNAKDMLPFVVEDALDKPIEPLLYPPHFVPETMTVANFVKMAQRTRAHIAVVVDEYGGTEGVVTLQDALREVVGDVGDEEERTFIKELHPGIYLIDGSLPLDELEILTGRRINDEEHTTVAGFFMDQIDKIPEIGDVLVHEGVKYLVESVQGKRIALLKVEVLHSPQTDRNPV